MSDNKIVQTNKEEKKEALDSYRKENPRSKTGMSMVFNKSEVTAGKNQFFVATSFGEIKSMTVSSQEVEEFEIMVTSRRGRATHAWKLQDGVNEFNEAITLRPGDLVFVHFIKDGGTFMLTANVFSHA